MKIEKNVPIPSMSKTSAYLEIAKAMGVGDSVFFDGTSRNRAQSLAHAMYTFKYSVAIRSEGDGRRVWRTK